MLRLFMMQHILMCTVGHGENMGSIVWTRLAVVFSVHLRKWATVFSTPYKHWFNFELTERGNSFGSSFELTETRTSPIKLYESPFINLWFNKSDIFSSDSLSNAHKSSTSIFSGAPVYFLMHPSIIEISSFGILSKTSIWDSKCFISHESYKSKFPYKMCICRNSTE